MKALILFGPLIFGCANNPPDRGYVSIGQRDCTPDVPELRIKRRPVEAMAERIRFVQFSDYCGIRDFSIKCKWEFGG